MGLRRQGDTDAAAEHAVADDDVYVVSTKVEGHAVKAEKQRRKAAKVDRKVAKAEQKAAAAEAKELAKKDEPVTGATVKRYLGIAKVVVPVLAPLVYQAVGQARSRWDDHQARKLGVSPDQLADFSGRGAALYARIHHLALSVRDLRTRRSGDQESVAFADDAEGRLADLEAAVRSAEQMPASRRRSAHAAVGDELDRLETRLLAFWGVDGVARAPGTLPAGGPAGQTTGQSADAPTAR